LRYDVWQLVQLELAQLQFIVISMELVQLILGFIVDF